MMEGLTLADMGTLFSRHQRLIATCRPGSLPDNAAPKRVFLQPVAAGAASEWTLSWNRRSRTGGDRRRGKKDKAAGIIVSFHDHEKDTETSKLFPPSSRTLL